MALRAGAIAVFLLGSLAGLPPGLALQGELPRQEGPPPAERPAQRPEPPAPPPVRVWRTGGLRLETAALLLSGQQGGDLPIAVLAAPLPPEPDAGGAARVALRIEVSGSALLAGTAVGRLGLDFAVYALGAAGDVEESIANTVEIDLARLAVRLREGGVAFSADLRLPAGEHSLRVLVRRHASEALALRVVPLAVPAAAEGAPRLLVPRFAPAAADETPWVEVRAAGALLEEAGRLGSARPVLELGQEAAFELPVLGLPAAEPALRVELLAAGAVVAAFPGQFAPRAAAHERIERLAATFVPQGVSPGAYELRVVITIRGSVGGAESADSGALRLRSPALPVVVASGVAGQVWARVERAAPAPGRSLAGAGTTGSGSGGGDRHRSERRQGPARRWRGDREPYLAAFRRALADLAAGQPETARGEVAALERQLLSDRQANLNDLADLESDVLAPIARANPEGLVPVLHLYELLYLSACGEQAFDLATHARQTFLVLAEIYPKLSHAEGARHLAARLLTTFAGAMEHRCGGGAAEQAFRQALALDLGYATPRLCLSVLAERYGDYRSEISLLEPLVRKLPDDGESRLRLALALQRSGDGHGARRQLEELVRLTPAAAGWAQAVGYQELAKMLLDAQETSGAEALLREALTRFPGDEKLWLLLGLVLDAEGKHDAAREAAEAIGAGPIQPASAASKPAPGSPAPALTPAVSAAWAEGGSSPATGPRHRYTELPSELLRRDAEQEPAWIAERLPALASALAATGAGKR